MSAENWKNHPAKHLLRKALKDGDIPADSSQLGPKAVYEKYKHTDAFANMPYDSNFTRRLRDLRKRSTEKEDDKKVDWQNHSAKKYLLEAFYDGTIPVGYSNSIGAQAVWDQHCKNNSLFEGMNYNEAFQRRLKSVEEKYSKKLERKAADRQAFDIYRRNHPIEPCNEAGELRWDGSDAQALLKEDMELGKHTEYAGRPRAFRETRPEYQQFSKKQIREHIQQEKRLGKFKNYLEKQNDK